MPKGSGRRGGWAYALISPRALQNSAFRPGSGFWGKVGRRESPKGQCLGFPEEDGAQPPGDSLPCCYRSPSGQGGEKGALGEEREAVAQHPAALEWAWGRGLCPTQWEGLELPGPDSTGAFTRALRRQAAASPSLTGMLIWALSRGALWPSRSTSTYGEGAPGSRGHSPFTPAPAKAKHGLVCTGPSAGLCQRGGGGGEASTGQTPTLSWQPPGGLVRTHSH